MKKQEQDNLKELFLEEINIILDGEKQIVRGLPNLIKAAESKELKDGLKKHLEETKGHVDRLKKICKMCGETENNARCPSIESMIQECDEAVNQFPASPLRDAAIICKAQKIEHYEIATYGTLCTFAKQLDLSDAADLLHETLNEEKSADKSLTKACEGTFFSSGVMQKARQ